VGRGVLEHPRDVEAVVAPVGPAGVAHRHEAAFGVVEEAGREGADVAEALQRDAGAGDPPAEAREQLERERAHAAAGGLLAAGDAVVVDRLAGDAGRGEPVVFAVLRHDPGHHVGRGAHVGGRDVDVGSEQVVDRVDEPAGHPLEFAPRELGGVEGDAPLRAAVGEVDDGRLPGHQGGEGPHLVEVDLGMVAEAALHGAAGVVVLHAVADVGGHFAGVELHRDLHLNLPLGAEQLAADAGGEVELVGGAVEVDAVGFARAHGAAGLRGSAILSAAVSGTQASAWPTGGRGGYD